MQAKIETFMIKMERLAGTPEGNITAFQTKMTEQSGRAIAVAPTGSRKTEASLL